MSIKIFFKRGLRYVLKGEPIKIIQPQIVSLPNSNLLEGRTALITGGTSGIGKSIALAFLNAGASVFITGRNIDKVENVVNEIKRLNKDYPIIGFELNNVDVDLFPQKIRDIEKIASNNRIDILVNNAGINGGDLFTCSEEEYNNVMNTNLKGLIFITRLVTQLMIKKGIQGNVLNIASSSSLRPVTSAYTLSKWGIKGVTIGFAKKLIKHGIVVNGIAPGPTATPMLIKDKIENLNLSNNPSGRYVLPEEVANMAVFLASGMGRMIVGDVVYMTGGAGTITIDDVNY